MPKISVIIPSVNGLPIIAECVAALERQECEFDYEIIVVDRTTDNTAEEIRRIFPQVILIKLTNACGIPEMRAIGFKEARGEYIAITEDHCLVPSNWLAEIVKTHNTGCAVVAGAVENGCRQRLTDWAVFLCEYSGFMPPFETGQTEQITGNNTSYLRAVLENIDEKFRAGNWEYFIHDEMKKNGIKIFSLPQLIVTHKKEFGFFYFIAQRFYYSRSFAAMRKNRISTVEQIFYLFSTPLLPFGILWRITKNVFKKRRNYKEFILSFPLLLIFTAVGAAGEFTGLLVGSGDSLLKVE